LAGTAPARPRRRSQAIPAAVAERESVHRRRDRDLSALRGGGRGGGGIRRSAGPPVSREWGNAGDSKRGFPRDGRPTRSSNRRGGRGKTFRRGPRSTCSGPRRSSPRARGIVGLVPLSGKGSPITGYAVLTGAEVSLGRFHGFQPETGHAVIRWVDTAGQGRRRRGRSSPLPRANPMVGPASFGPVTEKRARSVGAAFTQKSPAHAVLRPEADP